MKTQLFVIAAIITLAFSACSKDSDEEEPNVKLHKVVFTPEYFNSEITPLKSGEEKPTYFDYALFDSNGKKLKIVTYPSTQEITDELPSGEYTVIIVSKYSDLITLVDVNTGDTDLEKIGLATFWYEWPEIFIARTKLVVSEAAVNQAIVLKRCTGKIEFDITDLGETDATKIKISSSNTIIYASCVEPFNSTHTANDQNTEITDMSNIFMPLAVNADEDLVTTITLEVRNAAEEVIAVKTIPDVTVRRNCKTILTGKILTPPTTNATSFDITLQDTWGETINVEFGN